MKIIARVNGENAAFVERLNHQNISAKMIKNGVIVELPYDKGKYLIPPLNDYRLFIDVQEQGGGLTNTGSATIVCGLTGKPLKPYYCPRRGHLACGIHAYFSVPEAVVTITGYRRDDNVTFSKHIIIVNGNLATLKTETLWSGRIESLPNLFSKYKNAAKAAQEKANCYHCRCVHYSATS